MSEPYIGEIHMFGGNFAPRGYALCDGSLLPIAQYDALFSLIGTTYGGDGQTTFALPDLRGRLPLSAGQGPGLAPRTVGEAAGAEAVTLATATTPAHTHLPQATTTTGSSPSPAGTIWATTSAGATYAASSTPTVPMRGNLISGAGASQPHDNLMPFLCINFIIALEGVYPSRG
jgi:microcystin-dependent protein